MLPLPSRRTVTLGALAAGCATAADPLEGRDIYSESVMLSGADAEGHHFAAVRLCTYPEANLAWLWCMLLTPEGFWQFASNDLFWRGQPVVAHPKAIYGEMSANGRVVMVREGTHAQPTRATLSAGFRSDPRLGERDAPVARGNAHIEAAFAPAAGFGGLLPGRTESFGRATFRCRVDGREIAFEGPAQFHEQPQNVPRFTTPFAFASLWSAEAFGTFLDSPGGSGGYLIERGAVRRATVARATLASEAPALDIVLDGAAVRLPFELVRDYRIPIYGRDWRGRFVRSRFGEHALVGFLNSWQM